jgi:ATP-binding cassette, subfamily B, bacterial PglK
MNNTFNFIKLFFDNKDKYKIFILTVFLILTTFLEILSIGVLIPVTYNVLGISYDLTKNSELIRIIEILNFSQKVSINLIILVAIFILKNLFVFYFNKYRIDFFSNIYLKNSKKIYENYLNKDYEEHLSRNTTYTNQNIINELRNLTERLFNPFVVIISELLILLGIFVTLIFTKQYMIFFIILLLAIIGFIYLKLFGSFFAHIGNRRRENEAKSRKIVAEGLSGFKEILISNKQDFYLNRFSKFTQRYINSTNIFAYLTILPKIILETIIVIIFAVIIILSLKFKGNIPLENIILFLAISYRLMPIANRLALNFNYIKFSLPILHHLRKENVFKDNNNKNKSMMKKIFFEKSIKLKNINFSYKKNKKRVIRDFNLFIKKNTVTGIFGYSGSGKTTLVNLITGLLKPTSGKILLDNKNISDFIHSYQNIISYLSQDIFLMDDTILNNITFGEKLDLKKKKKLESCLKKVGLDKILKQKNGLYTNISEGGINLSGGQKQRVVIARSLYNDKELLILDEATSSLDKKSEQEILDLIYSLKKIKTIIIISHDLKLLKKADKILKI